ncbi:hypothetical protein GDO78_009182 [Eleutherodactylus coqui]|uniref:CAP-Gly domain-containing protein n=1 Tax=Eleutherodactylus coqui TaxID=57060 RepID=A0A8J6F8N5_ELECQ|nr:hypothetical protein GDO78_009182 [Eleutherodactylus coqui]KAG9483100.1 hypothetical protein GDO78_009182 [Eleutherodactylus coqui]
MAEESLWRTSTFHPDPAHQPSRETIREISKAWKTISNTKAALRHTESKLDVAPTSRTAFDPIMDAKSAGSSATRKISRKDGRYHEDSNAYHNKHSHPTKSGRERSSRSPLRVTTLDSNVKSSCRVGFREPLASYREVLSAEEKGSGSVLKNNCQEDKDFDSTRSSAVDETTVRYLNDRLAIDNLQLHCSRSDLSNDYRDVTSTESSPQHPAASPLSNRLESLKKRQPDAKLEKLKERIRRQWELSEERDNRERLPEPKNFTDNASAKTRKVTAAPPAPSYRGFNPPETKIRTPDGKVWQEAEFQNLSAQLLGTLPTSFHEGTPSSEKPQSKRTSRPVRKVQRLAGTGREPTPDGKTGSSSSRTDSHPAQRSSRSQVDTASKTRNSHSVEEPKHQGVSTEVKKNFLPLEIRGILDDLQLDGGLDCAKQTQKRSHSPIKRKSEKGYVSEEPQVSSKRRHYDSEQVRQYIMRQQEERKKKQNEQKVAQRQAEEQKNKRLQELYLKQKEAFSKAKNVSIAQREKDTQESVSNKSLDLNLPRPQDTYSKLLLGDSWPPQTEQEKQSKPLYQPSGESDKENKGQERPPSASSSSDLSLSEPLQPLLRSDLMEAYCPQPDKLTLPQSQFLALPKDLESLLNPRKNAVNMFPVNQKTNVQFKTSTDFKSNLDRIESLKATAISLSSRIENEAKKLAGSSITLPLAWSSDPDPKPCVRIAWRKPDSPPEKENRVDAFSNRIQKMLSTCSSHFSQDDLPGANHLYRKHPEELAAHTSALLERYDDKEDKKLFAQNLEQRVMAPGSQKKASPTPDSSTSSISEGPILSEDSFSDGEGQPRLPSHLHPAETLKNEFCMKDYKSFTPLAEFQREADKYPPLASTDFQGPWEELTKGSPHSVINIFTRTLQQHGKGLNGYEENEPEFQAVLSTGSPPNSLSYADDFLSSHVSELTSDSQKDSHRSEDTSASNAKEELPLVKSRSDTSPHSSQSPSAASSPLSVSSQRGSTKRKVWQNNNSPFSVKVEQNSSGSENKSQGSKRTSPVLSPSKDRSAGSDSDSTMGDVSSRSITSLMSDTGKERSQQSNLKDVGGPVPPPSGHQVGSHAPLSVTETGQCAMRFSPAGLHQRLSAELNYLGAMEESVRQLCDVERVRGISMAQQETVSLAQILKEQPREGDIQPSPLSSHDPSEAESRSPSPVSVSGSETSSIMQKLRKMHGHMDAKFLTKREQQLVQRRLHAQELLEWKRRLDAEELEIRQIEKQALAAWDNQRVKTKDPSAEEPQAVVEDKTSKEGSSAPPSPTIHTRTSLSPPPEYLSSESIEPSTIAEQIHEPSGEHRSISEELVVSGPSKMKIHITLRPHQLSHTWSEESLSMTHSAESTSPEKSLASGKETVSESICDKSAHTPVPISTKEDSPSAAPPSPTVREPLSAHDSPVSSIQSEIPEDVLDSQSNRSVSPLPSLDLKLGSETAEEIVSPHRTHSYSEDFETSAAFKHSTSETPREELDVSYSTTPGRDIPGEEFYQQDCEHSESKSSSPNLQVSTELKPPSSEIQLSSDINEPLAEFRLGDRVLVSGVQPGILRFKGETLFADGVWAGVELDKAEGNNDGSLGGNRYFVCSPLHGIFAPPQKIALLSSEAHVSSLEVKNNLETSLEPKEQFDERTPLIDDLEPAKTPLKSTESSISESHRTLVDQESQVLLPTDTTIPDEETQKSKTPLLEFTEKYSEDTLNKRAPADSLHEAFDEKDVTDFEPSRNILSILGDEPDWFDEDFGLSSRKSQQFELERALSSAPMLEPKTLASRPEQSPKTVLPVSPPEPVFAVPHTVPEVEQLVEVAVDKLWEWKQLSGDLQEIRSSFTCTEEEQSPAYSAYKEMLFDLTLYIFEEICSPDPRGSQPSWKKPLRVTQSYSRRVRDHSDKTEVKSFLTSEVLHLLSLRKEQNHKTDWQRMMKFGRKKRDRVDHILVQELHEEEAQWVNYDEDELFVKMQLADGIFEALIRDTIQVLQCIQNKKNQTLQV